MNNIALGRYMPLNSPMHKMDPRFKIVAMLIVMVSIFLPSGYFGYAVLGSSLVLALLIAKLKIKMIIRAMKPMMFMLVFLTFINALVLRTGYVVIDFMGFKLYSDALFQTLYIVVRLTLMIMVTTILTASTKPLDLTLAIEDLFKPLKKYGFPAHEIAMMISIALRFIPTLIEETDRIMKAQASRGVDLKEGSLKEKIMAILSLIVPLFVSSFQRAEELADAMEARGYVPSMPRTRYKQLTHGRSDYMMMSFVAIVFGVIVWLSF
jgi:energy-coupling factor transport system permease protein